jgi:hypothetical protein
MSAAEISHSIQEIGFLVAFRESALLYPIIMSTHLGCIALFGGMILVTDLRLIGIALTDIPVSNLVNSLRIWKRVGLTIMVFCGLLLATSEMDKYYANPYFQLKITILLLAFIHGFIFRRSVYTNTAELDKSPVMPGVAKLAGWTSIVMWVLILSLGRWIAYYEPPERRPGGALNPRTMIQQVERGAAIAAISKAAPPAAKGN